MHVPDIEVSCAVCNGLLRGKDFTTTCDNCHTPIDRTLYLPAIDLNTYKIRADMKCRQCGYNVKTLPLSSVCPECASPIVNALQKYSWFKRIKTGINLLLFAIVAIPAVFAISLYFCHRVSLFSTIIGFVLITLMAIFASGAFRVAEKPHPAASSYTSWVLRIGLISAAFWAMTDNYVLYDTFRNWLSSGLEYQPRHLDSWASISAIILSIILTSTLFCLKRISTICLAGRLNGLTWIAIWLVLALTLFAILQFNPLGLTEYTKEYYTWKGIADSMVKPFLILLAITYLLAVFLLVKYSRLMQRKT